MFLPHIAAIRHRDNVKLNVQNQQRRGTKYRSVARGTRNIRFRNELTLRPPDSPPSRFESTAIKPTSKIQILTRYSSSPICPTCRLDNELPVMSVRLNRQSKINEA
ncbi:hypothetical protein PUN28_000688 [Cardiocondyla obscurior]|uniref:Uncharacterized protein n=1 Tax=Cardiocondyla obscurior TaxID=286306 RepID=A0AAW2H0H3_9HYME